MEAIRDDLVARAARRPGSPGVEVRTVLHPAWTTDWISAAGRRKLAAAGIAPPGAAPRRGGRAGAADARRPPPSRCACPRCGHPATERISAFGATACRELRRCPACREPFEHVKEI